MWGWWAEHANGKDEQIEQGERCNNIELMLAMHFKEKKSTERRRMVDSPFIYFGRVVLLSILFRLCFNWKRVRWEMRYFVAQIWCFGILCLGSWYFGFFGHKSLCSWCFGTSWQAFLMLSHIMPPVPDVFAIFGNRSLCSWRFGTLWQGVSDAFAYYASRSWCFCGFWQ